MDTRVVAALAIITICAAGAVIAFAIQLPRRRREKLRRRGIKNYRTERSADRRLVR